MVFANFRGAGGAVGNIPESEVHTIIHAGDNAASRLFFTSKDSSEIYLHFAHAKKSYLGLLKSHDD